MFERIVLHAAARVSRPPGTKWILSDRNNLDFVRANASSHEVIRQRNSSLTPAQLLAYIAHARHDIEMTAQFEADFAANAVSASIIADRVAHAAAKKRRMPVQDELEYS